MERNETTLFVIGGCQTDEEFRACTAQGGKDATKKDGTSSFVVRRVVEYPAHCLTSKERTYRNLLIESLKKRKFVELRVYGADVTEFAREAIAWAAKREVPVYIFGIAGSSLERYGKLFPYQSPETLAARGVYDAVDTAHQLGIPIC
jgi:hypothetical protein